MSFQINDFEANLCITHQSKLYNLKMDEADLADFTALTDANGEIAKKDLIVHTKASSFWRGYMEAKSKPGSHTITSKVIPVLDCLTNSSYYLLRWR